MAIGENVSISLHILVLGMQRSCSCLVVVVCVVPLIPMVMMMGGNAVHPRWVINVCRGGLFHEFFGSSFSGEFVVTIGKFVYLHFKVWAWGKRWFGCWGAPNMHSTFGLRQVGKMHHGRWHVHGGSQFGVALSRVRSMFLPTFIDVILLWGGLIVCLLMCILGCYATWSLNCCKF